MKLTDIAAKAGQPLPDMTDNRQLDREGDVALVSRKNDGQAEHKSTDPAPLIANATTGQVNNLAVEQETATLPKLNGQLSEEARAMLSKVDPTDNTKYANPRYYSQTGGRRGFMYTYRDRRGVDAVQRFETGILVTHDIYLCASLDRDIARRDGIGHMVQNISNAEYENIVSSAKRYDHIRANSGMSGSDNNPSLSNEQKQLIDQQSASIQAMKVEMTKLAAENARLKDKV